MAKAPGVVAIVALVATLLSTIVSIWMERPSASLFVDQVKTLLAWKVIVGGPAMGTAATFGAELKGLLVRLAK